MFNNGYCILYPAMNENECGHNFEVDGSEQIDKDVVIVYYACVDCGFKMEDLEKI